MTLKFYKYSGDPKRMGKEIGDAVIELQGKLKEDTSMFSPTFIVNTNAKFKDTNKPNYLFTVDFNKYYFVRDVQPNTDGTCSVICEEDVMMTFKDQLKDVSFVIERISGNNVNPYLQDTSMPVDVRPHQKIYEFDGNGFSNLDSAPAHFILHCAGGPGTSSQT